MVKEAERPRASRSSSRRTTSATDPDNFYNADKNNFSPRLSAAYQLNDKTVFRAGFGLFYGPGQFEDRIQPIENYIDAAPRAARPTCPTTACSIPCRRRSSRNLLSIRGYTHDRPDEYNMQYGASVSRELPGDINLTVGYTGSQGKDMFLRGVGNTLDSTTRARLVPTYGQIDYKTSGCVDGLTIGGQADQRLRHASVRRAAARRHAPVPRAASAAACSIRYSKNRGTTQGSNEAGDRAEHVRLRDRVRHQPAGHPAHVQRLARLSDSR